MKPVYYEGPKTTEWPEDHKRVVFDIDNGFYIRRVVSRAIASDLIEETLQKIKVLGHKPVFLVRVKS